MSTVFILVGVVALGSAATGGSGGPDGTSSDQPATTRGTRGRGTGGQRGRRNRSRWTRSGASRSVGERARSSIYLLSLCVAVGIAIAAVLGLALLGGWFVLDRALD